MQQVFTNEEFLFLSILHHDARNGNWIEVDSLDGILTTRCRYQYNSISARVNKNYVDVYGTLNTFQHKRRITEGLFNISAIYIDLDYHKAKTAYEAEQVVRQTLDHLYSFFDSDEIGKPTMITATGRGLGLFYVLDHSIAATDNTTKQRKLYDEVYQLLVNRYDQLLCSVNSIMEVDHGITDRPRVVRIPGTMNTHIGLRCHLIDINYDCLGNPVYYSLQDIITKCNLVFQPKKNVVKRRNTNNVTNGKMLRSRISAIQKLQALRGPQCDNNCRELMCFIIYQSAIQLYSDEDAMSFLTDFNSNFTTPLKTSELEHIALSSANSADGYYRLNNDTIFEKLNITDEELLLIGWSRRVVQAVKRKKSEQRKQNIIEMLINTTFTYQTIADLNNCSIRSVKNIAAKNGIYRNKRR